MTKVDKSALRVPEGVYMSDNSHKNKWYVTANAHIIIDCAYMIGSAVVGDRVEHYKIDADGSVGYIPAFIADYFMNDMALEKVTDVPPYVRKIIADSLAHVPKRPIPQKADIDKILSLNFTLDEIKALHEKYKGYGWYNTGYIIGFPIQRQNSSFYDCILLRTPTKMMFIHFYGDKLKVEDIREEQTIAFFQRAFYSDIDMEIRFECFPE